MKSILAGVSLLTLAAAHPALAQSGAPTSAPASPPATSAATGLNDAAPPVDVPDNNRDIIVTALPFGAETPTIVSRVGRDTIQESGGSSIADALANVPGVSSSGFAPGASRPVIRGQDATRVRVLEDGGSSSDVSDIGPDHGLPIDPLSARSIEIVRGAATLRYGSQAIGGVVNILNNRVPLTLATHPVSGEITGAFDSVSDTGEGTALMDLSSGNLAAHADGFYRNAGDYDTPLGRQQNSFFHGYGLSAGASYFPGGGASRIGVAVTRYDAQYGIPSDDTFIDMRQTKFLLRSSFALGSGALRTLNVDGTYGDYTHDEVDPNGASGPTILSTFRNKEVDGHAELVFGQLGPIHDTALGVEVQHRDFSALGDDSTYLFPTTTDTQAAYLFTDTPIGARLHVQASGRVEHVRVTGTPATDAFTTRDFTPISGAIGVLYDLNHALHVGFTTSTTGRAPAITELFARGGHDGPNTFETGDPDLRIERAKSLEATLRINSGGLGFEGSLYSSWFDNYVYGQLTGLTCSDAGVCGVDGGDLRQLNYRQEGAWFRGAEAEAHYDLFSRDETRLTLKALADYTRATLDDGNNVPRIPPYRVGGGVNFTSTRFDAGVLLIHAGRQDKFGAFEDATPGYNQLTAQAAVRPFTRYPGVQLAVVGQNLTDDVQTQCRRLEPGPGEPARPQHPRRAARRLLIRPRSAPRNGPPLSRP